MLRTLLCSLLVTTAAAACQTQSAAPQKADAPEAPQVAPVAADAPVPPPTATPTPADACGGCPAGERCTSIQVQCIQAPCPAMSMCAKVNSP